MELLEPGDKEFEEPVAVEPNKREQWSKKREYILSLLGYSVGLGSLWRFPYLCNRNGGGAFLIPYFTCIITCALPIFFLEVSIGQFSNRSAAHVWALCPLFKGIGISQILASFISSMPYNLIIVWAIYYLVRSFSAVLPWSTCGNWWNTHLCVTKLSNETNITFFNSDIDDEEQLARSVWRKPNSTLTASEEFWQYNTLRVSSGLGDMESVHYHLMLAILASWTIIFLCLMKGVKSVGKVVYVTALLPYVLLTVLLIRSCLMPGAGEGLLYFLKPDFSRILSVQVWLEALLQSFYSMSTTFGGLITMSSYNKFNNNCLRDVALVTVLGEGSSIFCGLVVFSTLGFMAHEANLPVSKVVSSGPGLGFIIYPEAISQLPMPHLWSVLFFLMLLTVGVDSLFGPMETLIAGIIEAMPRRYQKRRVLVTAVVCGFSVLLSIPYACDGGVYIFQLLEWYASSVNTLIIGCLECMVVCWVYGHKRFSRDVEMMLGRAVPLLFKIMLSTFTPLILFVALVFSLFQYDPPTYGEYLYPTYAKGIGIFVAVLMSLPILVVFIYQVAKRKGSFLQRLHDGCLPSTKWGPSLTVDREKYMLQLTEQEQKGVLQRILQRKSESEL